MFTKEFMRGAWNCLDGCAVEAGDKIMLWVTIEERGAKAYEMRVRPYIMLRGEKIPDYVNEAAKGCDMVLAITPKTERPLPQAVENLIKR